jgi:serine/threonine protein kinase
MTAAGDCSVKPCGRALVKDTCGEVIMTGIVMELSAPSEPKAITDAHQQKIWMGQMTTVVLALHGKGIFHGDIKPANMLLCSDGRLSLCDLAEARKADSYSTD